MASVACRQPAVLTFPPVKFDDAFLDRKMRDHKEWQEQRTAELVADAVTEVAGAIGFVRQLQSRGAAQLEAPSVSRPLVYPRDEKKFFRSRPLKEVSRCGYDESCQLEATMGAETQDSLFSSYCDAHMHVVFADWMVGA